MAGLAGFLVVVARRSDQDRWRNFFRFGGCAIHAFGTLGQY